MRFKRFFAVILIVAVLAISGITVCGEASAKSFTRWETPSGQKSVYMRDMYEPVERVTVTSLGLDTGVAAINDIAKDSVGNIYLLCEDGKIIVFGKNYELVRVITLTENGSELELDGAKGIYISNKEELYISDTTGARILKSNMNGEIQQIVGAPENELIPSDFVFTPTKLLLDSKDYMYVISDGAYYGALLFSPKGDFCGFYGANTVQASVLGTIQYIWDTLTSNDVKRAKTVKTLPYQFIDIDIDSEDFVYTCTGKTVGDSVGQIRRLNPGGTNVLSKELWNGSRQEASSVNFGESEAVLRNNKKVTQNFTAVKVAENGMIYALDQTWGYIYVYDSECHLLTAFGGGFGNSDITGQFHTPCAMEIVEERIYVVDSFDSSVTVFECTDYGKLVLKAQSLTIDADYLAAKPLWEQVSELDVNSQLAIRGLAKAAYAEGDYEKAVDLAEQAYDSTTYTRAVTEIFNSWVSENIIFAALALLLLIALFVAIMLFVKRKSISFKMNKKLKIMLLGVLHPFDNYRMLKEEKLSSWSLSIVALIVFYITSFFKTMCSNFRYTSFDPEIYNSFFQLLQTVGMVVLWVIANWGISTLMQGNGRFKEVFAVSCYATVPLSIGNLLMLAISNSLFSAGGTLISAVNIIFTILAGIILVVGLMVIHEYSFPRFIVTAIIALFFMILAIFVVFMIAMLLSQCWQFVVTLYMEAIGR